VLDFSLPEFGKSRFRIIASNQSKSRNLIFSLFDKYSLLEYISSMKVKTSITLSEELIKAIDQRLDHKTRSEFIERVLWSFIAQIARNEQDRRDLEIINEQADQLNEEAIDVLDYQVNL